MCVLGRRNGEERGEVVCEKPSRGVKDISLLSVKTIAIPGTLLSTVFSSLLVLILNPVFGHIFLNQILVILVLPLPLPESSSEDVDLLCQRTLIGRLDRRAFCSSDVSSISIVTGGKGLGPAVGGFGTSDL